MKGIEYLRMTLCYSVIPALGYSVFHMVVWPLVIWLAVGIPTLFFPSRAR